MHNCNTHTWSFKWMIFLWPFFYDLVVASRNYHNNKLKIKCKWKKNTSPYRRLNRKRHAIHKRGHYPNPTIANPKYVEINGLPYGDSKDPIDAEHDRVSKQHHPRYHWNVRILKQILFIQLLADHLTPGTRRSHHVQPWLTTLPRRTRRYHHGHSFWPLHYLLPVSAYLRLRLILEMQNWLWTVWWVHRPQKNHLE